MKIRLIQAIDDPEIKRGNDSETVEVEEIKANALIRAGLAIPYVAEIEVATIEIARPRYQRKGKIETPEG